MSVVSCGKQINNFLREILLQSGEKQLSWDLPVTTSELRNPETCHRNLQEQILPVTSPMQKTQCCGIKPAPFNDRKFLLHQMNKTSLLHFYLPFITSLILPTALGLDPWCWDGCRSCRGEAEEGVNPEPPLQELSSCTGKCHKMANKKCEN